MSMQVIDARIRLHYGSKLINMSEEHPETQMLLWCDGNKDILQISAKNGDHLDEAISSLQGFATVEHLIKDNESALTMVMTCFCDGVPILDMAEESGCFPIGPKVYAEGWESIRLFAPNQTALKEYVSRLEPHGQVELVSTKQRNEPGALRELAIVPMSLQGGLTDKQLEVLVSAYESGLLCVPSKVRMDAVAKKVGLSRSTYGEHLRKAMLTLVENSYPVLKLFAPLNSDKV